ncbi:MAG: hypothetical protein RLZ25_2331 [Pseudomonadota bacterium]|jgi:BolA protein
MNERIDRIRLSLEAVLAPASLEIHDDSAAHAGHAGSAQHGGGHYSVLIVSTLFAGKTLVQRHQMVYRALGSLMQTDIHALIIKAHTPDEVH